MFAALLQRIRRFLSELRRRNVYQVAVTYVVVGFFVIEGADLTLTRLGLPPWTVTFVIVLVGVGFPIALILAWALEVTPEGVRVEEAEGSEEAAPAPASSPRDLWVGASVLALALLGAWWVWGGLGGGDATDQVGSTKPEIEDRSIAVLPFEVTGSGAEEWRDGMVTILSLNLDGAAGLRAIPDRRVFAAARQVDSSQADVQGSPALQVARLAGAKYAVIGSAVQVGTDLRLGAELRETASGDRLGQVEVQGAPDSIKGLTNKLTRQLLGVLLEKSEEQVPSVDLASITTGSLGAFKAFLDGERHLRSGESGAAIEDFESAIRQDSTFALAHARLGLLGLWRHEGEEEHVRQAYRHSERLPERARRLIEALYLGRIEHRTLAAARRFRALTEDYPDDPEVWNSLGEFLFHTNIPGGFPEIEEAHKRAVALDPENTSYYDHYVGAAFAYHRDSTMAARRVAAMPESGWKRVFEFSLNLAFGTPDERGRALRRLDTLSIPESWLVFAPLGHPTDGALLGTVLRRLVERDDLTAPIYDWVLVGNAFHRGQVGRALTESDRLGLSPNIRAFVLARTMTLGYPIPDSASRRLLAPENLPAAPSPGRLVNTGFYLIEQGKGERLAEMTRRLRAAVDTAGTGGPAAEQVGAIVQELRGWALRADSLQRAKRLLNRSNESGQEGAIWRGDLYRKLGQLQKAEGWYLAAWRHPLAHKRMGMLYEQMGKPEKAAAAYERFIAAWTDADPELQDRVTEARERLDALGETVAAE